MRAPAGQETSFLFRALNPGLYVYHCAVAPVGMHIANGMYGLILVEPKEGLPEVDREHVEGGTAVNKNVQTTMVPPGGSTMVEFRADYPGNYVMVDHAIFRALDKGANGIIAVTGSSNAIFSASTVPKCRSPIWGC